MIWAASLRRTITWLAVVGYGLVASGLPLPSGVEAPVASSAAAKRLSAKDRSTPFPCMDKPCGCATAEQCFTNCCCNTPAETLAWARAHKVGPSVIAALQRRLAAPPTHAEPSCCSAAKSCCEAAAATPVESEPAESSDEPASSKSISLRAMLACGGIVAEWLSCGGSLPPPPVVVTASSAWSGWVGCVDESMPAVREAPDAPPPRMG